jgi:hypothetical protein
MKSLQAQRDQILQQMAQLDTMEYGSLQTERRPAAGGGSTGPYYKHQVWEQGKNMSQRIPAAEASDAVATQLGYFQNNQSRMRYGEFRCLGLFIGSGVVEAGCKTVVGQRAKQSGMCWTETGLLAVLHTRCALLCGQFDAFWNNWNQNHPSTQAFSA